MHRERGAILLLVLAVLAMMGILAASMSRSAMSRMLAAQEFRRAEEAARRDRDRRGGVGHEDHATIGGGAAGALTIEGHHGSQTIHPGGDDRLGHGADRQGHR